MAVNIQPQIKCTFKEVSSSSPGCLVWKTVRINNSLFYFKGEGKKVANTRFFFFFWLHAACFVAFVAVHKRSR